MKMDDRVRQFYEKLGFVEQLDRPLAPQPKSAADRVKESQARVTLVAHAASLLSLAQTQLSVFKRTGDYRALRAHLMIEELGETLSAMAEGDEVKTLDGLADLMYVVVGTGATFDLPVEAAFDEVHASNMTKSVQVNDTDGCRVRVKGPDYVAPDIAGVLALHRRKSTINKALEETGGKR